MITINIVTREGTEVTGRGEDGVSIMEVIRDSGVDEMLALCGGCLSCATCHIYVAPEYGTLLPPISHDEHELLESSDHRHADSRLACQIHCEGKLNDIRVTVAPAD